MHKPQKQVDNIEGTPRQSTPRNEKKVYRFDLPDIRQEKIFFTRTLWTEKLNQYSEQGLMQNEFFKNSNWVLCGIIKIFNAFSVVLFDGNSSGASISISFEGAP